MGEGELDGVGYGEEARLVGGTHAFQPHPCFQEGQSQGCGPRRSAFPVARPRNCSPWLAWYMVVGGVARGPGSSHVWSLESDRVTVQKP